MTDDTQQYGFTPADTRTPEAQARQAKALTDATAQQAMSNRERHEADLQNRRSDQLGEWYRAELQRRLDGFKSHPTLPGRLASLIKLATEYAEAHQQGLAK